jgi:hypothetical protein
MNVVKITPTLPYVNGSFVTRYRIDGTEYNMGMLSDICLVGMPETNIGICSRMCFMNLYSQGNLFVIVLKEYSIS